MELAFYFYYVAFIPPVLSYCMLEKEQHVLANVFLCPFERLTGRKLPFAFIQSGGSLCLVLIFMPNVLDKLVFLIVNYNGVLLKQSINLQWNHTVLFSEMYSAFFLPQYVRLKIVLLHNDVNGSDLFLINDPLSTQILVSLSPLITTRNQNSITIIKIFSINTCNMNIICLRREDLFDQHGKMGKSCFKQFQMFYNQCKFPLYFKVVLKFC